MATNGVAMAPDRLRGHIMHASAAGYEFIEHTADLAIRVHAGSVPELFIQAARGMYALLGTLHPGPQAVESTIEIHASDAENLLHDWLAELLWQLDKQKCLFDQFRFSRFDSQHLAAHCKGTIYDPVRSERSVEIKAVTYHDLKIVKRDETYEVTVIFDI